MDLIFTQSETGKSWGAEFEATADFNLHIERDKGGNLMLYQRTNGGGWDIVNDFANPRFGAIDYDCAALIYPKFVKVVSEVEPTYAAVTSAGEVTEIKSQDKSVEVTSNGTIDVTPDAGFAYLNSVKVKTNVAQSGEGGGSASAVEYLDMSGAGLVESAVAAFSWLGKASLEDAVIIAPTILLKDEGFIGVGKFPIAVAIDFSANIVVGEPMTIKDLLILQGVTSDQLAALPRITEEEFYTL